MGDKEQALLPKSPFSEPAPEKRSSENSRVNKYLEAAATFADDKAPGCAKCLRGFKPLVLGLIQVVLFLYPIYKALYVRIYNVVSVLPTNVLKILVGVTLCFFGGVYTASIAAVEAFITMGGESTLKDLQYIWSQLQLISDESAKDDIRDEDKDGVADVDALDSSTLVQRKAAMAMRVIKDPDRLQAAVGSLWAAWLAVLATLRLEFARTTALALGMADMVKLPIVKFAAEPLSWALGPGLSHWTGTILDSGIKILFILVAWWIQSFISAFYTGLRGGKMFAQGLFEILLERGCLKHFPDFLVPDKEPFNPDTTHVDEMFAYPMAALGVYWQVTHNFGLFFPINVILFPLTIVEYFLKIEISMQPGALPA